ncbi:MAG: nucleotidyl transferase [Parcubacteria group bacterium Gr01-1014_20]|nr:MAG: nucleotidyl transferase [Parcubacteria group bacterium Gr01-1014_20]
MVHQISSKKTESIPNPFKNIDAVILCGGEGKRLRTVVSDRPKVLAEVGGRVFIDILVDRLFAHGFNRIILSTGYMKEKIVKHFKNHPRANNFVFSEEETPLGTGGALKKAGEMVGSENFLVMNGDSFCDVDLPKFYLFHTEKEGTLSIAVTAPRKSLDYGVVRTNPLGQILSFNEKVVGGDGGFVNAGMYFMNKTILSLLPPQVAFSIEYDLFPKILGQKCLAFISEAELVDIGTPERYEKAQKFFSKQA